MDRHRARLGTISAFSEVDEWSTKWFRARSTTHRVEFLDWAIDGTALREFFRSEDGELPQGVTPVHNAAAGTAFGRQALRVLLGEPEHPDYWTRMPDGRVPLLFCIVCYDLDCQTLTAELAFGSDLVEWRDIGWQVGYEPFDAEDQERKPITVGFDRGQYESEIRELLRTP